MNDDGPTFTKQPLTEEQVQKVARYVQAGWRLSTAMNQCDVDSSNRAKLEARLNKLGVKEAVEDIWG